MNSDQDNRRLLLAAALCLGVLGVWGLVVEPPPAPPEEPAVSSTPAPGVPSQPSTATKPRPGTTQLSSTSSKAITSTAAGVALQQAGVVLPPSNPEVEPQSKTFETTVQLPKEDLPIQWTLTNVGGAFDSCLLPSYDERNSNKRAADRPIRLADPVSLDEPEISAFRQMGALRFLEGTSFQVPDLPVYEVVHAGSERVLYRYRTVEGVVVEREWQFTQGSVLVEAAVTIRNESDRTHTHKMGIGAGLTANAAMKEGGGFFSSLVPPADHLQALCYTDGSVRREALASLEGVEETYPKSARWVAADRQYFLSSVVLRDGLDAGCRLERMDDAVRSLAILPEVSLAPGEQRRHKFTVYLGPKMPDLLTLADSELEDSIEYTIFGMNLALLCTFLLWILRTIHSLTGSWGVAILGLTFLVKLVLFPLNQRQGKSLRAMSALKPEMDALKEKFGEDRQRFNEEMLKLYRSHNVNPAGGCLPILIQMPIWIALYRSLWVSVDLYQEGFLWISDLTTRDPFWVLPVLLVGVMFVQQRTLPTTMDPAQQKILQYFMPLMFGTMMAALPAGLCLYILTNTLLTIVQQHFINKTIGPPPGPSTKAAVPEASS